MARATISPTPLKKALAQHGFDRGVTAAECIANDDAVGARRQLIGAIALRDFNIQAFQLRTHWRVDVRVAAADYMPRGFCERRNAAHERSADSKYVYVHISSVRSDLV